MTFALADFKSLFYFSFLVAALLFVVFLEFNEVVHFLKTQRVCLQYCPFPIVYPYLLNVPLGFGILDTVFPTFLFPMFTIF